MNYLNKKIVVMGLGYVGLPLAIKLSSHFSVIGYDVSKKRIKELEDNYDNTNEVKKSVLKNAKNIVLTNNKDLIKGKKIYIITVPTPVNKNNTPDLALLRRVSKFVGKIISKGAIIIFESTVYPGVTEKVCAPIISRESGYKLNENFYVGYSPERINPGDQKHSIDKVVKVVSGSNTNITKIIGKIYSKIVKAGVFYATSIEVAETAKAIENAQRDINIAFINEISLLCQKLNISVYDVLDAAKTKWNFLPFKPGLVGGHCIGVDPYYLAHIAKKLGASSEIILAGRKLNDNMTSYVSKIIIKQLSLTDKILQIGLAFKENVPDIRNSKAAVLAKIFMDKRFKIDVYDPLVDKEEVLHNYNIKASNLLGKYDCIIIAVSHDFIAEDSVNILKHFKCKTKVFDLTGKYKNIFSSKNIEYWAL